MIVGSSSAAGTCTADSPAVGQTTCVFAYTGDVQTWTVPAGVTQATVDVYGAAGGFAGSGTQDGGLGGHASAALPLTPGDTVTVVVGGPGGGTASCQQGSDAGGAGGFNGGASGGSASGGSVANCAGGGGGGASDLRIGGSSLSDRVLVAGGGGGAANSGGYDDSDVFHVANGGGGGGLTGLAGDGPFADGQGGSGGDQTGASGSGQLGAGSAGEDGNDPSLNGGGGGGGGGYYGGAGGGIVANCSHPCTGGGGGSGFGPAGGVSFETAVRSGDGLVTITYTVPTETDAPTVSLSADHAVGSSGWFNASILGGQGQPLGVTASADDAGGSGVASIDCTIDGGPVQSSATSPFNYASLHDGTHNVSCTASDNAGNTSVPVTATYKIDTFPPSVGEPFTSETPTGAGGVWFNASDLGGANEELSVHSFASDSHGSGVAEGGGCGKFSIGGSYHHGSVSFELGDGIWTLSCQAFDVAGNRASATRSRSGSTRTGPRSREPGRTRMAAATPPVAGPART